MNEVYVPLSNREVFQEGSANILPPVEDWLTNDCETDLQSALFVWDEETNVAVGVNFLFKSASDALRFKLTWGGK